MSTTDRLDPLRSELSRLALELDAEAESRFGRYLDLIEAWRVRAGVTAIRDADTMQLRLFGESLALLVVHCARQASSRQARAPRSSISEAARGYRASRCTSPTPRWR